MAIADPPLVLDDKCVGVEWLGQAGNEYREQALPIIINSHNDNSAFLLGKVHSLHAARPASSFLSHLITLEAATRICLAAKRRLPSAPSQPKYSICRGSIVSAYPLYSRVSKAQLWYSRPDKIRAHLAALEIADKAADLLAAFRKKGCPQGILDEVDRLLSYAT